MAVCCKPMTIAEFIDTHDLVAHAEVIDKKTLPIDKPVNTALALHHLAGTKSRIRMVAPSHLEGFTASYMLHSASGSMLLLARQKNPQPLPVAEPDASFPGEYLPSSSHDPDYRFIPLPIGLRTDAHWAKPSTNNT